MITLKAPSTADLTILTHNIVRRTAGGDLDVVSRWTPAKQVSWQFENMTSTQVADLKAFLCANAGLPVEIVDDHGQTWHGVILTNDVVFEKTHRDDCGGLFRTSLDFEGEVQ